MLKGIVFFCLVAPRPFAMSLPVRSPAHLGSQVFRHLSKDLLATAK